MTSIPFSRLLFLQVLFLFGCRSERVVFLFEPPKTLAETGPTRLVSLSDATPRSPSAIPAHPASQLNTPPVSALLEARRISAAAAPQAVSKRSNVKTIHRTQPRHLRQPADWNPQPGETLLQSLVVLALAALAFWGAIWASTSAIVLAILLWPVALALLLFGLIWFGFALALLIDQRQNSPSNKWARRMKKQASQY